MQKYTDENYLSSATLAPFDFPRGGQIEEEEEKTTVASRAWYPMHRDHDDGLL